MYVRPMLSIARISAPNASISRTIGTERSSAIFSAYALLLTLRSFARAAPREV